MAVGGDRALVGRQAIVSGAPAVSTSSRATSAPSRRATATSLPGANGTCQVRCSLPELPFGLV